MFGSIKIANNFIQSILGYKKEAFAPIEAIPEAPAINIFKSTLYYFLENYYKKMGVPWEEINMFGIQNENKMNEDVINDWICIADNKTKIIYKFRGSTNPGIYYTNHLINSKLKGVAHIANGYHPKVYVVGFHKGKYEAMVQRGAKIRIWRDVDKDFKKSTKDIVCKGWFGTNIHKMSDWKVLTRIGRYSAGCQIIADPKEFRQFMSIVKASNHYKRYRGAARFSYMIVPVNSIPQEFLI